MNYVMTGIPLKFSKWETHSCKEDNSIFYYLGLDRAQDTVQGLLLFIQILQAVLVCQWKGKYVKATER